MLFEQGDGEERGSVRHDGQSGTSGVCASVKRHGDKLLLGKKRVNHGLDDPKFDAELIGEVRAVRRAAVRHQQGVWIGFSHVGIQVVDRQAVIAAHHCGLHHTATFGQREAHFAAELLGSTEREVGGLSLIRRYHDPRGCLEQVCNSRWNEHPHGQAGAVHSQGKSNQTHQALHTHLHGPPLGEANSCYSFIARNISKFHASKRGSRGKIGSWSANYAQRKATKPVIHLFVDRMNRMLFVEIQVWLRRWQRTSAQRQWHSLAGVPRAGEVEALAQDVEILLGRAVVGVDGESAAKVLFSVAAPLLGHEHNAHLVVGRCVVWLQF